MGAPDDTPPLTLDEIVQARQDFYNRMTVPVMIGDAGPYRFMIDTGSQATIVSHALSDSLALPVTGKATLVGMGSTAPVDLVTIDDLGFAGRSYSNISAPRLHGADLGADGILGLDSLQDLKVVIDFRSNRIFVADADTFGRSSEYEIVVRARRKLGQMIITDATIDGNRVAVVIDTGAQASMGNNALRRKFRDRTRVISTATDVNGTQFVGQMEIAKRLRIGSLQLENVQLAFVQSPAFASLGLDNRPALILGMDTLRGLKRVAIDFSKRRVLFDLPVADDSGRSPQITHEGSRIKL